MITLASDFGSPYPAAMKGVILRESDARLVDVTHELPRQDVRAAAFWTRETLPYFPPAVHLVVVDPGVGTDRAALVGRVGDHAVVAPDNGVVRPVARRIAAETGEDPEWFTYEYDDPASTTFHGRDVFAPAAAAVHEVGVGELESLPSITPADDAVDLRFPTASVEGDEARGEVLVVDDFGNAVTNVPGAFLDGRTGDTLSVNGTDAPVETAYAAVEPGDRLVTVGSHGYVECDVNRGRGDDAFGLEPGDDVRLRF
ncbi:SAM hydrolase/SAM-dependent halogenase family protein [Halopelagius fulvigenes]|uniref:S-adenosyl-l-methionine hydroxide adenosyltransferase family protein n=1 Tax=Halopelagius fulvigenes TaxID=1198324 RepID=A0ABD5U728_9EURY